MITPYAFLLDYIIERLLYGTTFTVILASVIGVIGATRGIGSLRYLASILASESTLESVKLKMISIFFHFFLLSGIKGNDNCHVFMSNGHSIEEPNRRPFKSNGKRYNFERFDVLTFGVQNK